ncbi:MAG: methylated-DNA--[protein]-cysteine S-methyltransferase [Desulfobaccales bacterium]
MTRGRLYCPTFRVRLSTPLGPAVLSATYLGLSSLEFTDAPPMELPQEAPPGAPPWLSQALDLLTGYFAGRHPDFSSLPLDLAGTPFQHQVWQELQKIPPGQTLSYGELARRLGKPTAARAVGQALKANPLPLIIPCHRVIAADGSIGGFSAGLTRKRWLLAHEGQ